MVLGLDERLRPMAICSQIIPLDSAMEVNTTNQTKCKNSARVGSLIFLQLSEVSSIEPVDGLHDEMEECILSGDVTADGRNSRAQLDGRS